MRVARAGQPTAHLGRALVRTSPPGPPRLRTPTIGRMPSTAAQRIPERIQGRFRSLAALIRDTPLVELELASSSAGDVLLTGHFEPNVRWASAEPARAALGPHTHRPARSQDRGRHLKRGTSPGRAPRGPFSVRREGPFSACRQQHPHHCPLANHGLPWSGAGPERHALGPAILRRGGVLSERPGTASSVSRGPARARREGWRARRRRCGRGRRRGVRS